MAKAAQWCSVPECLRPKQKGGMCGVHYQRNRKYGDVNVQKKDVHSSRKFLEIRIGKRWAWLEGDAA